LTGLGSNESPWYLQRLEAFLKEVYADDAEVLSDISQKRHELSYGRNAPSLTVLYDGVILNDIWENVFSPGWNIGFHRVKDKPQEKRMISTEFDTIQSDEDKVKYSVECFQKTSMGMLYSGSAFDEPTSFKVNAEESENLPVIEEIKRFECSISSVARKPAEQHTGKLNKIRRRSRNGNHSACAFPVSAECAEIDCAVLGSRGRLRQWFLPISFQESLLPSRQNREVQI
jgi:hypothetical protein